MKELKQQARIDRKMCQRSLYYLCKEVLGYKDMVPHIHGDYCYFLTHPSYGRFRQATLPRSWFKTWIGTIGKSIWLTLPDEEGLFKAIYPYKGCDIRILIASNVIDNAAKMVHKIKAEWENNERLKAAFPELVPDYNRTRWSDHAAEVKRSLNTTEATYTAVGAGGSVISQHFDHIIEDDLVYAKKDDFTGQELMPTQEDIDNAIGWHKLAFSLLSNPNISCIDNIGTRWAPQDLIHYIRTYEHHYVYFEVAVRALINDEPIGEPTWPERYGEDALKQILATQGPRMYECFPKETPILMSNWHCKPISQVKVGDEVVGFSNGQSTGNAKLVKSKVTLVEKCLKPVVRIALASGNFIRCTEDHPWYTGRCDKTHEPYLPAKVGRKLLQIYNLGYISTQDVFDYRYLAGLIDGEGACNYGSIAIGQSKEANPDVYKAIKGVLSRLNIPYKISTVNPNDTHILRDKTIRRGLGESFVLGGGRQVKGDIIRHGTPAKANRILSTIWSHPHNPIKAEDKVISIKPDGEELVYAIGTTSGNYVAWGYATKNTQYLNRPRPTEDVVFKVAYVNQHTTLSEYPHNLKWYTMVDLAGWGDSKGLAKNVVLTGAKDGNNHLWIARVDRGRFNPTEVINKFKQHAKQFNSKVMIEEIQYQRAIRHFAKLDMEKSGELFSIEKIPYDGRKNAKDLRIRALEPLVSNGMLHILTYMKSILEELEFYPQSRTKDVIDCIGYLYRIARAATTYTPKPSINPLSLDAIETELKNKALSSDNLPFAYQLLGEDDAK